MFSYLTSTPNIARQGPKRGLRDPNGNKIKGITKKKLKGALNWADLKSERWVFTSKIKVDSLNE